MIEPAGPLDVYAAALFLGLGIAVSPFFLIGIGVLLLLYVVSEVV